MADTTPLNAEKTAAADEYDPDHCCGLDKRKAIKGLNFAAGVFQIVVGFTSFFALGRIKGTFVFVSIVFAAFQV